MPTRTVFLLPALAVALCSAPVFAQQTAAPAGPEPVGVAAAVKGSVTISSQGAAGRIARSGQAVYLGDLVATGPGAGLQILLRDETVFTVGPDSAIAIDRFIYDPASESGSISARVTKGVFRFVTGKIARKKPEDMEIKMPHATIGIRGTIGGGIVRENVSQGILHGPGPQNNSGEPPGRLILSGASAVTISRPGYGSSIGEDGIPTPPAPVPQAEMKALSDALALAGEEAPAEEEPEGPAEGAGEGAPSPTEEAQQDTVAATESLSETESVSDLAEGLEDASTESTQQAANADAIADGISTLEQLRTVETGTFHFPLSGGVFTQTVKNGSTVSLSGTISGNVDLDFGARTFGGGNSSVTVESSSGGGDISTTQTFESQSFSSGSGSAAFSDIGGGLTATFTLNNSGGSAGKTATVSGSFDNGLTGSSRDTGSITSFTSTRAAGAS